VERSERAVGQIRLTGRLLSTSLIRDREIRLLYL